MSLSLDKYLRGVEGEKFSIGTTNVYVGIRTLMFEWPNLEQEAVSLLTDVPSLMCVSEKKLKKPKRKRKPRWLVVVSLCLIASFLVGLSGVVEAKAWGRLKNSEKFLQKLLERAEKSVQKIEDLRFSDLDKARWALGAIARLRGLGIVNGYGGNIFRPQNPVKQAEALTMIVKAFGLEEEAQELDKRFRGFYAERDNEYRKSFKIKAKAVKEWEEHQEEEDNAAVRFFFADGIKLPYVGASTRWALGYVLLAVDQGWVEISEIFPEKPASREWIAKVMVRALGYGEEAEAKMDTELPFLDAASVSPDARGYVAQAVEIGLFHGYDDNTFQPQRTVTRAEMATILDRFIENELPAETPYHVTGVVKEVSQSSITVSLKSGRQITYSISEDVLVVFGKVPGTVTDIKAGDSVQILSNGKGVALLIMVKNRQNPREDETTEIYGEIVATFLTSDGKPGITLKVEGEESKSLVLADDCVITHGFQELSVSHLTLGDRVVAEVEGEEVTRISIVSQTVSGKIYGTINSISLMPEGVVLDVLDDAGESYAVRLRADVRIAYGSQILDPEDLSIGDRILVRLENNLAYQVTVTARSGQSGRYLLGVVHEIEQTDAAIMLKIRDRDGYDHTVRLASNVRVTFGDSVLAPQQIALGDTVRLRIQNQVCTEVCITSRYQGPATQVTGVIFNVSTDLEGTTIGIKLEDGTVKNIRVAENAKITYRNRLLRISNLEPGDRVEVHLRNQIAFDINVQARNVEIPFGDLGGEIVRIDRSASGTVIVVKDKDNDGRHTIRLSPRVKITYGTRRLLPSDLRLGDVVRVEMEDQMAVEIRVVSRRT